MTPDQRASRDLPALQDNLRTLVALASKAFPLNIGKRSHLRFMLASFAMKQIQHARSVLRLGTSLDTMLIARSMLEGLSQVLWAVKQPRHRPLLWRAFAFVLDSRQIQRYRSEGRSVDAKVKHNTRVGLARYGRWFLTKQAREARATGRRLPADPYTKNWYGEREIEIFRDVGGQVLWEHAYGPFSEWHHWRVGAIGRLVSFDPEAARFTMATSSPSSAATASACAFQCLWQTMSVLNSRCRLRIGAELRKLRQRQLKLGRV